VPEPRLTFLLDVDNTLLDNDRAKADLAASLVDLLGQHAAGRFWELYEVVRTEQGMVNVPLTLARFEAEVGLTADANDDAVRRGRRFAVADLVMSFPYADYLFPNALAAVAHLRELGRVAILSDGDPTFQPSKIWRAGLDAAVDGAVLVFDHKEAHLDEVVAAFPADHYVLVEDKPDLLTSVRGSLGTRVTTILVRQGRYAATVPFGSWEGADLTLDRIGDLRDLQLADFWLG